MKDEEKSSKVSLEEHLILLINGEVAKQKRSLMLHPTGAIGSHVNGEEPGLAARDLRILAFLCFVFNLYDIDSVPTTASFILNCLSDSNLGRLTFSISHKTVT